MLIVATIVTVVAITGLIASVITGVSVLGWAVVGLAALGLALLVVDSGRERRSGNERSVVIEHRPTGEDQLFGEHDVQRDIEREEHATSSDMVRFDVPVEEAAENILHPPHGHRPTGD